MKSLPTSVQPYQRTAEFTESTLPKGMRQRHSTRDGVWGLIHVLEGSLTYRILAPESEEHVLTPEATGVIEPRVPHAVEPIGRVRFFVEFHR